MNSEGGKWRIRLRKGLGSRYWEELVLAIIGEQFDVGDEICGAVISVRPAEDVLSVWTKTADNLEATTQIRDQLRRILHLPANIPMDYKKHQDTPSTKPANPNTATNSTTTAAATAPAQGAMPRQHMYVMLRAQLSVCRAACSRDTDAMMSSSVPPPRREWGQSVTAEVTAEKEAGAPHHWDRRQHRNPGTAREGETTEWAKPRGPTRETSGGQ